MRKTLYLLFALTILLGLVASSAGAQQAPSNVEQRLLDTLARDGKANFFIKMSAVADLSAAYTTADWTARGQFVVDTLQKVATESQKAVIEYAQKNGVDQIIVGSGGKGAAARFMIGSVSLDVVKKAACAVTVVH